jgi:hypothetical protein
MYGGDGTYTTSGLLALGSPTFMLGAFAAAGIINQPRLRPRFACGPYRVRPQRRSWCRASWPSVSNAYNRPDQLSADLRKRVLATAQRMEEEETQRRLEAARQATGTELGDWLRPERLHLQLRPTQFTNVGEPGPSQPGGYGQRQPEPQGPSGTGQHQQPEPQWPYQGFGLEPGPPQPGLYTYGQHDPYADVQQPEPQLSTEERRAARTLARLEIQRLGADEQTRRREASGRDDGGGR